MNERQLFGSETAKGGFRNEEEVISKFNNWKKDKVAQEWLTTMNYIIDDIEYVKAVRIMGSYKTDVQVQVTIKIKRAIDCENLSIKLVSNPQGFNQIDKREIDKYINMWNIPNDIEHILRLFTGKIEPKSKKNLKDPRRTLLTEMSSKDQRKILNFFNKNKILIISDVLKGRGRFSAGWMLVILKKDSDSYEWVLKDINTVMNIFGQGEIRITNLGSLKIGEIGMQRKGGDGGRDSAKMLQFKINPCLLFKR
ncbi:type II restriction endonuclease [Candidatus Pacearchaeota archaeon]|nr:type II restriction endonuclease [Candidatus Pacearchaeota archaeon]|tara:strand:- start:206 stop:961 length:756 start_codon:yes stop_codon:yes gene_type:complete